MTHFRWSEERVALLVLVLRRLLAQAVARDAEAAQMQAELDEVI